MQLCSWLIIDLSVSATVFLRMHVLSIACAIVWCEYRWETNEFIEVCAHAHQKNANEKIDKKITKNLEINSHA
jgi:hypothetical protein